MSMLLRGAPAAAALNEKTAQLVSGLREKGVVPTLAIVRLGAREDDLSYERAAVKRCAAVGIETRCVSLPENASGEALEETLRSLSNDASVHGILLLRPLPAALDEAEKLRGQLLECVEKDAAALAPLAKAYAIPKDDPARAETLETCLLAAAAPPMEVLELTGRTIELLRGFADMGSPIAVSDAAVGAASALAALRGAEINVRVNTRLMQNRERAAALDAKAHALVDKYVRQAEKIYDDVYGRLAR